MARPKKKAHTSKYISLRDLTHLIVRHMRLPYPRAQRLARAALSRKTCMFFNPGPWWPRDRLPPGNYQPIDTHGNLSVPPGEELMHGNNADQAGTGQTTEE